MLYLQEYIQPVRDLVLPCNTFRMLVCKWIDSIALTTILNIRVFHDPLVSLNFEGFDPQISLNDPKNSLLTFFNSYEGGHCDPLNRKLRENPEYYSQK